MKVKILELGKNNKGYATLKYVEENGTTGSLLVFNGETTGFKVDDWAELEVVQKGKFTNLKSLKPIRPPENISAAVSSAKPGYMNQKHPDEQKAIARAVALDKAVTYVLGTEVVSVQDTLVIADQFLDWLLGVTDEPLFGDLELPKG